MEDEDILGMYAPNGQISLKLKEEIKSQRLSSSARLTNTAFKSPQIGLSPSGYSPAIQNLSEKYGNRTKAGDVIFRSKCKDSGYWESDREGQTSWNVELLEPTSNLAKDNYKYMFQKVKEVALAMDFHVEDIGSTLIKELKATDKRASLKGTSVDEGLYVGRIRSDGKLTSGSVFFEGCIDYSDGHIVSLDLSSIDEYHVFPGQVAVLEGNNELGKCVRVTNINVPKPLPLNEIKLDSINDPLNIIVAVGPLTPGDSVQFEPLKDLISVITRDKPDLCILMGPFLESTHKMIEVGGLKKTFEEIFQMAMDFLTDGIKNIKTQVVLVPSYKDVNGHFIFPTPPYAFKRTYDNVKVLPDPASISVNGIIIGITSTDILMHLGRNELANSTISGDRMGRLARHILSQRNFYPLYPSDESVPLDVIHLIRYGMIKTSPHVLILPSDLRHFIKEVDGTVVVNPERLTKGSSGGTYARIQIDLTSASKDRKFTSVADFCVGEIIKI